MRRRTATGLIIALVAVPSSLIAVERAIHNCPILDIKTDYSVMEALIKDSDTIVEAEVTSRTKIKKQRCYPSEGRTGIKVQKIIRGKRFVGQTRTFFNSPGKGTQPLTPGQHILLIAQTSSDGSVVDTRRDSSVFYINDKTITPRNPLLKVFRDGSPVAGATYQSVTNRILAQPL
jgi:hypothetical protein